MSTAREPSVHSLRVDRSLRERWADGGEILDTELTYRFWFDGADLDSKDVDGATRQDLIRQQFQISEAITTRQSDDVIAARVRDLGQTLYRLILSSRLRQRLEMLPSGSEIEIDTPDYDVPWELLHDGREFLSLRFAFGRQVYGARLAPVARRTSKAIHACVVGNPTGDLPAAAREANAVYEVIRDALDRHKKKYRIATSCRRYFGREASKRVILQDVLLSTQVPCDILHYAGHATLDTLRPESSSLSLADGQLKSFEIEELSITPIVFANACSSGTSSPSQLATDGVLRGIATAFLKGGATGFIGTLWPVTDDAARMLAVAFYRNVIQGSGIGEALRQARAETVAAMPSDASAFAYVLFGSPGRRLPLFEPEMTAGPFINDRGFEEVQRIEMEHSAIELLLVNDLPWILWREEDFIEWVSRIGISDDRRRNMLARLMEYRRVFRRLVSDGVKKFVSVVNMNVLQAYLERKSPDAVKALIDDARSFSQLENFTLVLYNSPDREIEEIELVSKNADVLQDPTQSVYVFNKQTRFETSLLTYYLYAEFNPALIEEYVNRFFRVYDDALRQYGLKSVEGSRPFGRVVNEITLQQLEALIIR